MGNPTAFSLVWSESYVTSNQVALGAHLGRHLGGVYQSYWPTMPVNKWFNIIHWFYLLTFLAIGSKFSNFCLHLCIFEKRTKKQRCVYLAPRSFDGIFHRSFELWVALLGKDSAGTWEWSFPTRYTFVYIYIVYIYMYRYIYIVYMYIYTVYMYIYIYCIYLYCIYIFTPGPSSLGAKSFRYRVSFSPSLRV